jgi:hypothetical protein
MKKIFTLFIFAGIASSSFAQTFNISEEIGTPGAYGNYHPQIEITNDGLPGVLWSSTTLDNIYFAKHNGVDDFDTPVQVNPTGTNTQVYNWSGPDLASWGDNLYVTYKAAGYMTGPIYLVKSTDNGISFGDTVRVDNLSVGFANYPDVAVYNDTVFVTFMDHDATGMDPQYVVARSTDGGATFGAAVDAGVLLGDEACDCCQPEIVANDKYVIMYFRNNASNIRDIKAVVSYDRGASFTNVISVDDHLWGIMSCPSTGPDARIQGDTMISVYKSEVGGDAKIYLNEFDLALDSSLNTIELSVGSLGNANYPQVAYSGSNMGAVWESLDNSTDIFFNWSTSGASGFNSINIINVTDTSGVQSKPDITYGNGVYHVIWSEGGSGGVKYVQIGEGVNVTENILENAIHLFPNPVDDLLNIQMDLPYAGIATLNLVDLQGKLVTTKKISVVENTNKSMLNLSGLNAGSYFIEIQFDGYSWTEELIKK